MKKSGLLVFVSYLIAAWMLMLAMYTMLSALMTLGPTDFHGEPNSVMTNVVGFGHLSLIYAQFATILYITIKKRWRLYDVLFLEALMLFVFHLAIGGAENNIILLLNVFNSGLVLFGAVLAGAFTRTKPVTRTD